jgi:hypothetical protein
MALVIIGWLIGIYGLVHQSIYTLRTGQTSWFIVRSAHPHEPMKLSRRIWFALVYLFFAVFMTTILASQLSQIGIRVVKAWMTANYGLFLCSLSFLVIGLVYVVRPEKLQRWIAPYNPEFAANKVILAIWRIICVVFIVLGAAMLSKL